MIDRIVVKSFKSLSEVTVELGQVNVFVGANGSGKSNLLEAVGVLSAAADGQVNDQNLLQRGVRPGVPQLFKSSFSDLNRQPAHIYFEAKGDGSSYAASLNNPTAKPSWRYKTELWVNDRDEKLVGRSPNTRVNLNTELGLAALEAVRLRPGDPAVKFLRRLQRFVIFAPNTAVLRGVAPESQPRQPVGLSGGGLPAAVQRVLKDRRDGDRSKEIVREARELISWASSFGVTSASNMVLSAAAQASERVIRFKDRHMHERRNTLSGYDASEGALYVLFLLVLAAHRDSPEFFAVDNADHGLNPGLASALMDRFCSWMTGGPDERQALLTTHNPAVLDGLTLQDDRVRLFTVDRDNLGHTVVRRVMLNQRIRKLATQGWTLSRLWTNKLIGGMPDV